MYQSLLNFLASWLGAQVTAASAPVTDTTVSANNATYTAPANITSQVITDSGSNDSVTSNAAKLVVVDTGNHDSTTTSSANVTFVAEGASDSLTLTAAGENAIIDLTDAATGANNATVLDATKDNATLEDTNFSCNYSSYYYCSGVPYLDVNGNGNKVRLGSYNTNLVLNGADNVVVGNCASYTVTTAAASGPNVVIGGAGSMTVNSAAIAMSVIGGSGNLCATLTGDFANLIGGAGQMVATLTSNYATVETGSGTAQVCVTGSAGTIVTGAGTSIIHYTDSVGGGLLYQGAAKDQYSEFDVNAQGVSIFGGDVVNATGSNIVINSRAAALTDQGGTTYQSLQQVVYGEAASLLPDPDIQAALQAVNVTFLPSGVAATSGTSSSSSCCCSSYCCPSTFQGYRTINLNGQSNTVNGDTRSLFVTVNGSNDALYGGTAGQIYWIQSGGTNNYYAGAGNNMIVGDGGTTNILNYQNATGPTVVNLACNYAVNGFGGTDWLYNMNDAEIGSNSTAIAGSQSAVLMSFGSNSTLQGGMGSDTLTALGDHSTLMAGMGNDVITTTGVGDAYSIGMYGAMPKATMINQQAAGVTGTLSFLASMQPGQLWLTADTAGDLMVDVLGSAKTVTLANWFSAGSQLSSFAAGGKTLMNSGINNLETAMATYQAAHPSFNPMTATALPSDSGLQAAFAAWH